MQCFKCATPLPDNSRFCSSCGADVSGASSERTQPLGFDAELLGKLQADVGTEYVIERELGRGGMAAVYLAIDVHLGRKVAIKVLPPELTFLGGPQVIERFKREARTAATLDHPHIIPIHRVSTGGTLCWYVMKYLEGRTLADILGHEAPLPLERTADIIAQAAQGLEYSHRCGVIHRDVKPENIMIDAEGWVTVTDFGIAKALDTSSLTGSGSMIGTPYYMSPEQCAGQQVSGASDQYSLAVVAYQMLSGHLPFTGQAVVDVVKKHCMDPPPPLAVLQPSLPPELVAVVERGLAKKAGERFGSVKEFATALSETARHPGPASEERAVLPNAARSESEPDMVPHAVESGLQLKAQEAPAPIGPSALYRRRLYIALGAAAVGLGGIIFWPAIRGALLTPGLEGRNVTTTAIDTQAALNTTKGYPVADPLGPTLAEFLNSTVLAPEPDPLVMLARVRQSRCDRGELQGCAALGAMYQRGEGVAPSDSRAVALYQRACDGGSMQGCAGLALMLSSGRGVPRDDSRAAELYHRACAGGDTTACQSMLRVSAGVKP